MDKKFVQALKVNQSNVKLNKLNIKNYDKVNNFKKIKKKKEKNYLKNK